MHLYLLSSLQSAVSCRERGRDGQKEGGKEGKQTEMFHRVLVISDFFFVFFFQGTCPMPAIQPGCLSTHGTNAAEQVPIPKKTKDQALGRMPSIPPSIPSLASSGGQPEKTNEREGACVVVSSEPSRRPFARRREKSQKKEKNLNGRVVCGAARPCVLRGPPAQNNKPKRGTV